MNALENFPQHHLPMKNKTKSSRRCTEVVTQLALAICFGRVRHYIRKFLGKFLLVGMLPIPHVINPASACLGCADLQHVRYTDTHTVVVAFIRRINASLSQCVANNQIYLQAKRVCVCVCVCVEKQKYLITSQLMAQDTVVSFAEVHVVPQLM